jgi:hypothetical protein
MTDMIVKIMVKLLSVLALATKQIEKGRFCKYIVRYPPSMAQFAAGKFTQKLLGESEIEAALQQLDRLTQEEARMTGAQTLSVVYGLVGSMTAVMEGTEWLHIQSYFWITCLFRWQGVDRPYSRGFG